MEFVLRVGLFGELFFWIRLDERKGRGRGEPFFRAEEIEVEPEERVISDVPKF